jgi:hypothetical protein
MRSATVKLEIVGDTYNDIVNAAEIKLTEFLGVAQEELTKYVAYEINVTEASGVAADLIYKAELIARIKDVRN